MSAGLTRGLLNVFPMTHRNPSLMLLVLMDNIVKLVTLSGPTVIGHALLLTLDSVGWKDVMPLTASQI